MRAKFFVYLLSMLLTFAGSFAANAAPVSARVCVDWKINLADASGGIGDDYYTDNNDKDALGVLVYIKKESDNALAWSGYASDTDGCTSYATLDSATAYYIQLLSIAQIGSNYVWYSDESSDAAHDWATQAWSPTGGDNWTPTSNQTKSVTNETADYGSNVTATGAYVLSRHNGGLSSKVFDVYQGCVSASPCVTNVTSGGNVYLQPGAGNGDNEKYRTAHELGHAMLYLRLGGDWGQDCTYSNGGAQCEYAAESHAITTKEKQSCALSEGWAHFVSAATWNNDDTHVGCYYRYYKVDIDHDADGTTDDYPTINCETGNYPANYRYMETECSGSNRGYAGEWDWLAAFWDLRTDEDIAFNTLLETLADTDPVGTAWSSNELNVYDRLSTSANSNGYASDWDSVTEANGVDDYVGE